MSCEEDLKTIEGFVGEQCERTLACNSLKIRFGEKTPYIWVDPPWEFWNHSELVTSSFDYPDSDEEFQEYSDLLNPLNSTKLVSYEHSAKNGLILNFRDGYKIHVPTTIEAVEDDDFYQHWYARAQNT